MAMGQGLEEEGGGGGGGLDLLHPLTFLHVLLFSLLVSGSNGFLTAPPSSFTLKRPQVGFRVEREPTRPCPCPPSRSSAVLGYKKGGYVGKEASLPFANEMKNVLMNTVTEIFIAFTVLLGCVVIAGLTLHEDPKIMTLLNETENALNYFFILEYCCRWYANKLDPKYLLGWEMIIDFTSFLPFVLYRLGLGNIPGFTFLRLLRVLRLQRFLKNVETFQRLVGKSVKVKPYQLQLARIGSTVLTFLFVTSGILYSVEGPYNENLNDYFDAFYFSVTTFTTVGFGDVTPVTRVGRAVVAGSILIGTAIIPYQLSQLSIALRERGDNLEKKTICFRCEEGEHRVNANFCWRCGSKLKGTLSMRRQEEKEERAVKRLR